MNIIKEGTNIPKPSAFTCPVCGCIFEANDGEFKIIPDYFSGYSAFYYKSECPMCYAETLLGH